MEDPLGKGPRRSRRGGRKRRGTAPAQTSQQGAPRRQPGQGQGRPPGQQGRPPRREQGPQGGAPRSVPRGQLPDNIVYGINAVAVALDLGQLKMLFFDQSRQTERTQHLHAQAQAENVEIRPMQRQGFYKILPADQHQGVAGMLHEMGRYFLEEIVESAGDDSAILILDRIQDPQNLGAVLRTAAATGVDAVVLPKAGGCPVTPAVHKASAGMSLRVPIVEDENLVRAIEFLKDHGYWVIGCDSSGGEDATTFEYPEKRVIVMGNEAEGMRRLVQESCDYVVRIPMVQGVESLNISVATAVVLYLAQADLARAAFDAENGGNGEESENGGEEEDAEDVENGVDEQKT